jgi:hypothetical protein
VLCQHLWCRCLPLMSNVRRQVHNLATLRDLALNVRAAILIVPVNERPPVFQTFPRGSCGWASLLLGAILVDNQINGFVYVFGERESEWPNQTASHAWLSRDSLVIDITAGQFADAPEPVLVANNSGWHEKFEILVPSRPTSARASALKPIRSKQCISGSQRHSQRVSQRDA